MKRLLLTTALLVTATNYSEARADHLDYLRREYELNRTELTNDYRSRLEAYRFAYNREREGLLLERKRAYRIDCHETRAARVRAINRAIGDLAREHGNRNRKLSIWFAETNRSLRKEYDLARANARRATRPVVVESRFPSFGGVAPLPPNPIATSCDARRERLDYRSPYAVPFGSSRFDSNRFDSRPVYRDAPRYGGNVYLDDYRGVSRGNNTAVSIASLIMGLLND